MKNDELDNIEETIEDAEEEAEEIIEEVEDSIDSGLDYIEPEDEDESEDEVPSSDYSDYDNINREINDKIKNKLRDIKNQKQNSRTADRLNQRQTNTMQEQFQVRNGLDASPNVAGTPAPGTPPPASPNVAGTPAPVTPPPAATTGVGATGIGAGATGAGAAGAGAAGAGAAGAGTTAAASGIGALVANPYFWIAVGIILLIIILVVIFWAAYNKTKNKDKDETGGTSQKKMVCNYNVNGATIENLKVRLLECGGNTPIAGEDLIDFDKYVLGVTYAENEGGPAEGIKSEALAAKSYALRRPDAMGYVVGLSIVKEDGQDILQIRNCTSDQVYCDPDKGCWSDSSTAGSTVHSGYVSGKAWSKPGLAQDSNIRAAVDEIKDKILVDSTGNVYYSTYTATQQEQWNEGARAGKTYKDMLEDTYSGAKVETISCTTTDVADGGGGTCETSTPIKLAAGETYSISSRYGPRTAPTAGASSFHKGVDIGAATGTPLYSVFEGTVAVSTDDWGSGGKAVLINHDVDGDGLTDYTTEYMHMSKRDVEVGDKVTGGQKIGEVGSTGVSTGPHLHFGIKDASGNHFDPEPDLLGLIDKTSVFDKASVCKSSSSFTGNFPYYNQCDASWADKRICDASDYVSGQCIANEKVCDAGCGYVSFSMIASGFNNDSSINPSNTVDFVSKYSYNSGGGALTDAALTNQSVLDNYKLNAEVLFARCSSETVENKKAKIVSALKSGKAVELLVPSHFVALVGIDSNEKITLNDPGNRDNVGSYSIDELYDLFVKQRSHRDSGCSPHQTFVLAVAYSKR